MNTAYLLVYNDAVGTREEMKACLNSMPSVKKWRYDINNAFYIISDETAQTVSEQIRAKRSEGLFILTEISSNSWGWLTAESWYLIQNKDYKPK